MKKTFSALSSTNFNGELFSYYSLKNSAIRLTSHRYPSHKKYFWKTCSVTKLVLTPPKGTLN
jgi:hypothetical protein